MDIIKRLAKRALKKAQRVRNPEAVGAWLAGNKSKNPSGTGMYAIAEGIKRNEWNSPDGLKGSMERYGKHHGTSSKQKKGHEYPMPRSKKYDQPLSDKEREDTPAGDKAFRARYKIDAKGKDKEKKESTKKTDASKPLTWGTAPKRVTNKYDKLAIQGGRGKNSEATKFKQDYLAGKATTSTTSKKASTEKVPTEKVPTADTLKEKATDELKALDVEKRNEQQVVSKIKPIIDNLISTADKPRKGTPPQRIQPIKDIKNAYEALDSATFQISQKNDKPFKAAGKKLVNLIGKYEEDFPLKKASSSRRLLNILKSTAEVDNDQIEKDLIQALNQAMKKHADGFNIKTGNTLLKKKISLEENNLTKGIGSALLAMLAGYALTPKVNPGEMSPAQQRQWERTISNQMRKKNLELDSDTFKALQNFYKDQSDTYTRRKPAKNGVSLEKVLTSPPFQGAEFDPVSHRWKQAGQLSAQTGQVNIGTGGKRRIRGAGTGAAQRSVGGHKRGIVRESRRGVAARAARKKVDSKKASTVGARLQAYKKLTRKRK